MKARFFILVLAALLALAACDKPTMPPPQEDILYQTEYFFAKKPDSALKILDTLNVNASSI